LQCRPAKALRRSLRSPPRHAVERAAEKRRKEEENLGQRGARNLLFNALDAIFWGMSHGFEEVSFESTRTMGQAEFADWVRAHEGWDPNHYELLSGRIIMNPPAGYPHGEIENKVGRLIGNFVDARRLGKVFGSSQGYALETGDTLEPDASFVSNARWAAGPRPEPGRFLRIAPNLVVEILSASTASRDRGEKRSAYERAGVEEYWIVDWRAREIVAYGREGEAFGKERVCSDRERFASSLLAGLEFEVQELFP
jgi:Uma2 family endonuclease